MVSSQVKSTLDYGGCRRRAYTNIFAARPIFKGVFLRDSRNMFDGCFIS